MKTQKQTNFKEKNKQIDICLFLNYTRQINCLFIIYIYIGFSRVYDLVSQSIDSLFGNPGSVKRGNTLDSLFSENDHGEDLAIKKKKKPRTIFVGQKILALQWILDAI